MSPKKTAPPLILPFKLPVLIPLNQIKPMGGNAKADLHNRTASLAKLQKLGANWFTPACDPLHVDEEMNSLCGNHRDLVLWNKVALGEIPEDFPVATFIHTRADAKAAGMSYQDYRYRIMQLNNEQVAGTSINDWEMRQNETQWVGILAKEGLKGLPWAHKPNTLDFSTIIKAYTLVRLIRAQVAEKPLKAFALLKQLRGPSSVEKGKTFFNTPASEIQKVAQALAVWDKIARVNRPKTLRGDKRPFDMYKFVEILFVLLLFTEGNDPFRSTDARNDLFRRFNPADESFQNGVYKRSDKGDNYDNLASLLAHLNWKRSSQRATILGTDILDQ